MTSLGIHELYDFHDCDRRLLNNMTFVREAMLEVARVSGATIVTDVFHRFNPQGVSGVVVIAESHIAIHTWPEFGCASVDVFSCSRLMDLSKVRDGLMRAFAAERMTVKSFERGERREIGMAKDERVALT